MKLRTALLFFAATLSALAADKRIKDLTTTASSPAADDYVAVDGTTNGTRKMLIKTQLDLKQAADAQLDTWATVTPSANGQSLVAAADYSAMRTLLTLVPGTDVQAYGADLTALEALSGTNTIYYRSASNTWTGVTIGANMTFTGGTLDSTSAGGGVSDGDKGDIVVASSGAAWALDTSGAAAGTYGSTTIAPVITVDAKGRITSVSNATIASSSGNVTNTTTLTDNSVILGNGTTTIKNSTITFNGTMLTIGTAGAGNITANAITANNFTVSDLAVTTITLTNPLGVASGGTGRATFGAGNIILGNTTGGLDQLTPGTGVSTSLAINIGSAGGLATSNSTTTFTEKTIDASASGNVLKSKGYIYLTHPHLADGTNATIGTTATSIAYGHATFSNSVDEASNYVEYYIQVPEDIDTSVALRARLKILLGNTDTAAHEYVLSSVSVADSAVPTSATLANAILVAITDGTGANGDVVTSAWTTLTSWAGALTAGQTWRIRLARDGDEGTTDASTVNSTELGLVIEYGITQ